MESDEELQCLLAVDEEAMQLKAEPLTSPRTSWRAVASLVLTFLHGSVTFIARSSSFSKAPPGKAVDTVSMSDANEVGCANFVCPDGFRLKSNATDITDKNYITGCCEEAMCTCDCNDSGTSSFSCNFEVREHDCGAGYICNGAEPWRYTMDKYQSCQISRLEPSNGELYSFYVYRSCRDSETFLDGMNVANAVGEIVRIQQEVLGDAEWYRSITRIRRLKVTLRPTTPLLQRGRIFSDYLNYDTGRCNGPLWPYATLGYDESYDFCSRSRQKYGTAVGCTNPNWLDKTGAALQREMIWYSLPGPCPNRWFNDRDAECVTNQPSGRCHGPPTGSHDCTYSVEPAGEIGINELCGYSDLESWYKQGNRDYVAATDKGIGCSFWDNISSMAKTKQRAAKMESLFEDRFGSEDLMEAYCNEPYDFQDLCPEALVLDQFAGGSDLAASYC